MKINIIKEEPEYYYRAKLVTWQEAVDYGKANGLELLSIEELCEIPHEELMKIPGVLAGLRSIRGVRSDRGTHAFFWSSSESCSLARSRYVYYGDAKARKNTLDKAYGFSAIYKSKE